MEHFNWDKVVDLVQSVLVWFVIGLTAICIATLILFDTLAGTGVMSYLTNKNYFASVLISLATTGLLMALLFIGYSLMEKRNKNIVRIGWFALLLSFGVYCLDVVFDSFTADVLRFGQILPLTQIQNPNIHMMYRILIGGISTVGEPIGIALIVGMPVLKKIISDALPLSNRMPYSQTPRPAYTATFQAMSKLPQRQHPAPRPAPAQQQRPEPTYHPVSYNSAKQTPPMPETPDFDELAESYNKFMN